MMRSDQILHMSLQQLSCNHSNVTLFKSFNQVTLTHWSRVTHICVSKLTIIGSDNGLSPGRHQAITWTKAVSLLIWPLGTNFSEILIEIQNIFVQENAFENVVCEMSAILSQPQCVYTLLEGNSYQDSLPRNSCQMTYPICRTESLNHHWFR